MKISDLWIKLGLKKDGFDKGIDSAKKKTNAFGSAVKKIGGYLAGAFAVSTITNFAKESLRLYNIQAQAEQQLLVALKGRRAEQQDLIKQAQQLQRLTLFGDEETIRAQALIAAFVKEKEQIKSIIPLVQDLATAKMMSLAGAADLVSKTLGSSINALSRYGIEVNGAVGSAERLESLMKGLNDAFGGQAQAAAQTGTGSLTQLSNVFGDLKEGIGEALNNSEEFSTSVNKLSGQISHITENLDKYIKNIGRLKKVWDAFTGVSIVNWIRGIGEADETIKKESESQEKATSSTEDFKNVLSDVTVKASDYNKRVEETKQRLDDISSASEEAALSIIELYRDIERNAPELGDIFDLSAPDVSGIVGDGGVFNMFGDEVIDELPIDTEKIFAQIQEFNAMLNSFKGMVEGAITDIAASLGEAFASGDWSDFGSAIFEAIGGFMQQLGALLIAYAVNMGLFAESVKNPLLWPVALAAGVAMVAAGAAISSFASKGLSSTATTASGYSPSSSSASTAISGDVKFVLEGNKLIGAINNSNRRTAITG